MSLHVWRVGKQVYSCALTVVTHDPALTPDRVRQQLAVHEEIVHSTIEIHFCPEGADEKVMPERVTRLPMQVHRNDA